jgi:hypothetical protein
LSGTAVRFNISPVERFNWRVELKATALALLITVLACPSIPADAGQGAICMAPNPSTPPTRVSPGLNYNPETLKVKIDDRQAVPWPHKECLKIEGLDITKRHLVVFISDGKQLQSFRFGFSEFQSNDLCMSFDGYGGPQLREAKGSPWCKCK